MGLAACLKNGGEWFPGGDFESGGQRFTGENVSE
jgi:hypothetical protein